MPICILKKIFHPTIFLLLPFYLLILFRPQYNFWSTRTKETTNFYYHYGVNKNVQFSLLYYYFTAAISKHFCREGAKYLTKKEKKVRRNYRNWKIFWEGLHSATAVLTWAMGKNLKKWGPSKKAKRYILFATTQHFLHYFSIFYLLLFASVGMENFEQKLIIHCNCIATIFQKCALLAQSGTHCTTVYIL